MEETRTRYWVFTVKEACSFTFVNERSFTRIRCHVLHLVGDDVWSVTAHASSVSAPC